MLTFSILLTLTGAVLGPIYLACTIFWSGEIEFEEPIVAGQAVVVHVSPEMNPVAFFVRADYSRDRVLDRVASTRDTSTYDARMTRNELEVWTDNFAISPQLSESESQRVRGSFTTHLRTILVNETSDFEFSFVEKSPPDNLDIEGFALVVRGNVTSPNIPLGVVGCVMIPIGIGGILMAAFRLLGFRRWRVS